MFHVKHSSAFRPAFPIADSARVCNIRYMPSDRPLPVGTLALASLVAMWFSLGTARDAQASAPTACATLADVMDGRASGPVFLPSYPTVNAGPLHGAAFLYDNAVATIALMACGQPQKARRIGDAIVAALDRDRYWRDGRLRNAYLAGPVASGPIKLPGWWDTKQNKWVEDQYQAGSDNGNMAWAILALLSLDRTNTDGRYRSAALRVGNWILRWRSAVGAGGFTGGTFGDEPKPSIETWKATEHNTDIAAAFMGLAQATGDAKWLRQAAVAQKFVRAMWSAQCRCFAVGTGVDGLTRNATLALDAQIWPLLALPGGAARYSEALKTARDRLSDQGGYAYSEALRGFWTEGTAQVALLLELSGRDADAQDLMRAVASMRTADGEYYASSAAQLPTGFMLETDPSQPRQYFHIAHLAALSWAAIASKRYNPFTRADSLP
jgi:hypothetical protein